MISRGFHIDSKFPLLPLYKRSVHRSLFEGKIAQTSNQWGIGNGLHSIGELFLDEKRKERILCVGKLRTCYGVGGFGRMHMYFFFRMLTGVKCKREKEAIIRPPRSLFEMQTRAMFCCHCAVLFVSATCLIHRWTDVGGHDFNLS